MAAAGVQKRIGVYRRVVQGLATRRWFAALGRRFAPVDRFLYRCTRGRLTILGPQGAAMPQTCLLTTIGRRSGKQRTTPVMFLSYGTVFVVSTESFGQQRLAAWALNLEANPKATVQVGKTETACRARCARPDEVKIMWPRFVAAWPAHEAYLARSGVRKMFVLEPQDIEAS